MSKFKLILIGFSVVLLFGLVITVNIQIKLLKKRNADICRLTENYNQLMRDDLKTTTLFVKEKELTRKLKAERDSLAKALRIRPKDIEKIVYVTTTIRDTINHEIFVVPSTHDKWVISDSAKCYVWNAVAYISEDKLKIERTDFTYFNKTTETFYKRKPHKFLFFRIGKTQYLQQVDSECGTSYIKTINFLR